MAGIAIVPEGLGAATVPNIASRRSIITVLSTVPRRFHTSGRIAPNERSALQHGSNTSGAGAPFLSTVVATAGARYSRPHRPMERTITVTGMRDLERSYPKLK